MAEIFAVVEVADPRTTSSVYSIHSCQAPSEATARSRRSWSFFRAMMERDMKSLGLEHRDGF